MPLRPRRGRYENEKRCLESDDCVGSIDCRVVCSTYSVSGCCTIREQHRLVALASNTRFWSCADCCGLTRLFPLIGPDCGARYSQHPDNCRALISALLALTARCRRVARRARSGRGSHDDLRRAQRYGPELERRLRRHLKPTNKSWRVDETYIRAKSRWYYLYRAIDSTGATIDF